MAPVVEGWDYVSLPVEDMERALSFYRDVLDLPVLFVLEDRWAEFDLAALRLAIYPREEGERRGGDLAFGVEDLEAAMGHLEDCGVRFPHGVETFDLPTGRGRLARFQDSSGNRLELVEWHEPRRPIRGPK